MGKFVLLSVLLAAVAIPSNLWAKSSGSLALMGIVKEKLDYRVVYDAARGRWSLEQSANGSLRAVLQKSGDSGRYTVTVLAP